MQNEISLCKVDGCNNKLEGRGMCQKHYRQWLKDNPDLKFQPTIGCKVEGCDAKHFGKGYCQKHHMQWRRHGHIVEPVIGCKVEGCSGVHCGLGYCERHYLQWKKYGKIYGHPIRTKFDSNPCRFENNAYIFSLLDSMGNKTKEFLIDKEDYDKVKEYKWGLSGKYVSHSVLGYLHWFILGIEKPEDREIQMDHRNMNTFDNRKCNLRVCTRSQNGGNINKRRDNTSGYKGVFRSSKNNWRSQIGVEGKLYYLGVYPTKEEAALAYNIAAEKYFGEFARPNQI